MAIEHRHPRCVTPSGGAPTEAAVIAELRREVGDLKLQCEGLIADRDALLEAVSRITAAVGLPDGYELDKVIQRIEGLAAGACP